MPSTTLEKTEIQKKTSPQQTYQAPVSLYETSDSYIAVFYLPGADEKSVNVSLNKGLLVVEAQPTFTLPEQSIKLYGELNIGACKRSLTLSDQIDESKIEAVYQSGLLQLTLPKSKQARTKNISIKTA